MPFSKLLTVYVPLIGWTGLGWILGRLLPASIPAHIGKFLFWVGVPIGILGFLRHTSVEWSLWIAPAAAWAALSLGVACARFCLRRYHLAWDSRTRTSFLLASMVGNTGYIGFPVSIVLVGPQYFAWAVFYDMLGSTPGAYGLGVTLAARSQSHQHTWQQPFLTMAKNPAFWSFGIGLMTRDFPLHPWLDFGLTRFAWMMVSLSLVLVGMRLSRLSSLTSIRPAMISLTIKMLLVPLVVGSALWLLGINGNIHRAILLQMAMPPAFATLVIAEAYELDQEMAVTAIAIGSVLLLITLPIWLFLFSGAGA